MVLEENGQFDQGETQVVDWEGGIKGLCGMVSLPSIDCICHDWSYLKNMDQVLVADGIDVVTLTVVDFHTDGSSQADGQDEGDEDQPVLWAKVSNDAISRQHAEGEEDASEDGEDDTDYKGGRSSVVFLIPRGISVVWHVCKVS